MYVDMISSMFGNSSSSYMGIWLDYHQLYIQK